MAKYALDKIGYGILSRMVSKDHLMYDARKISFTFTFSCFIFYGLALGQVD